MLITDILSDHSEKQRNLQTAPEDIYKTNSVKHLLNLAA